MCIMDDKPEDWESIGILGWRYVGKDESRRRDIQEQNKIRLETAAQGIREAITFLKASGAYYLVITQLEKSLEDIRQAQIYSV